ncbi:hypothetical protein [Niastella yeongjuensis]|uniref:hypothetical protein n=1 Tax=Niastella yeongjuensis TaxID=354355 RepID=UPI0010562750|nr:hypothetical protein [Niastella yeongjuensis]
MAETVNLGSLTCKLYDLVQDFKRCLNPKLYQKLWENSIYYSPPYLVLCAFNEKPQQTLLKAFTVMDWEEPGISDRFVEFVEKNYPDVGVSDLVMEINKVFKK